MKKLVCMAMVAVFAAAGCGGGSGGEDVLRIGMIPNQNPEEVEAQYEPLGEYLSEELGMEVEVSVPTGYPAVVEAMASDRLDLAHFGGLTYVQAKERTEVEPLVTEVNTYTGTTNYRSLIIVPADSDIEEVSELEGETFAFGSVSSTSGSLYPAIMLAEAGVDYRTDLEEAVYTGGHDATAQAVANETVAAGGIEDRILYDLQREGIIEEDAVRTIDESEDVEGYPWAVRSDMDDDLKEDIATAFIEIEDPELLDLFRAEGFERVEDSDYDYVDEQARELDLITAG
ncbi:MAG: phosphate/phosphite/phosphonate ABC transporter substrate-binding protein [Rubrobacter sp.]|nr:phosphate/phosphite/phosphonate ABC transporter substrate-binding protein [Rubrobacter sp.]